MGTIAKRQRGARLKAPQRNIFSWIVLALRTTTVGFTIFLAPRSFTPVLYVDQWSII